MRRHRSLLDPQAGDPNADELRLEVLHGLLRPPVPHRQPGSHALARSDNSRPVC
jgi:hypothetical protein